MTAKWGYRERTFLQYRGIRSSCCYILHRKSHMKRTSIFIFAIFISIFVFNVQAQSNQDYGDWEVRQYVKGAILVSALNVYGQDPGKGIRPTFMVNYGSDESCLVSFGLIISKSDLSSRINNTDAALTILKSVIDQSGFFADDEFVPKAISQVQAIDMGEFLYARTKINADALSAFMSAKNGGLRTENEDSGFIFSMDGFDNIMSKIIDEHCG